MPVHADPPMPRAHPNGYSVDLWVLMIDEPSSDDFLWSAFPGYYCASPRDSQSVAINTMICTD